MKLIQRVKKEGGVVQEREKLIRWFNRLLDKIQDGELVIELNPTDRTDAQNKYYWVLVHILAQSFGISDNQMHEFLKSAFLPSQDYFVLIKKKQLSSTTEQNKDEMTEYIEKVIRFGAEQGIVLPDAEEYKHQQNY